MGDRGRGSGKSMKGMNGMVHAWHGSCMAWFM
jgi:hypothetical protein